MKLYELAGERDDNVFSPYCWRIRMALAHKGIETDYVPCRFVEKELLENSGQGLVPVLEDGDAVIHDSWNIACYLEDKYPDAPSLFGGDMGKAQCLFFKHWAEQTIHGAVVKIIIMDIFMHLHEKDRAYFRETREKRFGMTLEEFEDRGTEQIERLAKLLSPVRASLQANSYLCGDCPGFADYILFGMFQWARSVSETALLSPEDPIYLWRDRLQNSFNGMPLKTMGYNT